MPWGGGIKSHTGTFVLAASTLRLRSWQIIPFPRSYPAQRDYKENGKKIFKNLSRGYVIGLHPQELGSGGFPFNGHFAVIRGKIWPLQETSAYFLSLSLSIQPTHIQVSSYLHWNFSIDPASVNAFQTSHFFLWIDYFPRFLVGVTFHSTRRFLCSC